ncbi:1-acyl-sn-glycerol-3-phosphate acyltransferase [Methylosinus sporium]|uniref:1-acyl-sn-glycerol-3-phosphate acyltransferase n=1 Tax=Methylosinus sporium TaxID=428 RepID=A0A549SCL8_METSR|nr:MULTISPECIES: lysophospholipid acyltransferase family protein [Methylosinus]MBU3890772.1 1-acyl-sn-glycerol-3-phosphate acyltransferase [Methylosinus sp. KRF6]TRL22058.1 1-acyl-sn-glycerol-3-phosphate acyltransferase [Methylosinus sporium]
MPYLRAITFVLAMAGAFVVFVPIQWLARRRRWELRHRIQTGFCRVMCRIIGIEVRESGAPGGSSPRFVVANHVSWTDIIALASLYPLVFLAKAEVASWPVLGFLARLQGTVFVERGNRRAIPIVNAALAERLRAGDDVVVFAEGTSSDGAGVLKFNASHFAMLSGLAESNQDAAKPTLVPTAIVYTRRSSTGERLDVGWYGDMTFLPHLWSLMKRGGAKCHILWGEAVDPSSGDRKALAAATEASVRELLAADLSAAGGKRA